MDNSPVGLLRDQFAKFTDPRTGHAKLHKLIDAPCILVLACDNHFTHMDQGAADRVLLGH